MGVYECQCYGSESLVIRVYERQSYGSESLDMVVYECQCYEAEAGNWMVGQKEKNQKITVAKEKKNRKKIHKTLGNFVIRSLQTETERGPERSCRINTEGSQLALEIRNTSATTKTRVAYGNSHLACV